jgi:carboxyl-terminal processing protease
LEAEENITVADSLRFVTPGGKIVYGGGGIIPDIFVPKDTSVENETIQYVSRSGFMSYFIFEYLETHRKQFEGMPLRDFIENYSVPASLSEEFVAYARFGEARIDLTQYQAKLDKSLKANIAQQIYGPNAYEYILNEGDPMISKVLELEARRAPQE